MDARKWAVGMSLALVLGGCGDDSGDSDPGIMPGPGDDTPTDGSQDPSTDDDTPDITPPGEDTVEDPGPGGNNGNGRPTAQAPVVSVQFADGSPAVGTLIAFKQGDGESITFTADDAGTATIEEFDLSGGPTDLTVYLEGYLTISFAQLPSFSFNQIVSTPITMDPLSNLEPAPQATISGTHTRKDQDLGFLVVSASTGGVTSTETDEWSIGVDVDTPFKLFAYDLNPNDDQTMVEGIEWFRVDSDGVSADTTIDSLGEVLAEERFLVDVPAAPAGHPLEGGSAAPFLFAMGPEEDWLLQLSATTGAAEPADGVQQIELSRPVDLAGLGEPFVMYQYGLEDSEAIVLTSALGFGAADPSQLIIPSPPVVEVNGSDFTWQMDPANERMIVETWISDGPDAQPSWILIGLGEGAISMPTLPDGVTLDKMTPSGTPQGLVRLCGTDETIPLGCARLAISEPFSL